MQKIHGRYSAPWNWPSRYRAVYSVQPCQRAVHPPSATGTFGYMPSDLGCGQDGVLWSCPPARLAAPHHCQLSTLCSTLPAALPSSHWIWIGPPAGPLARTLASRALIPHTTKTDQPRKNFQAPRTPQVYLHPLQRCRRAVWCQLLPLLLPKLAKVASFSLISLPLPLPLPPSSSSSPARLHRSLLFSLLFLSHTSSTSPYLLFVHGTFPSNPTFASRYFI